MKDIVKGFELQGYEVYLESSWMITMRRWTSVNISGDTKTITAQINIYYDNEEQPTQISVRYSYVD
jgi:hypothetical protein